MKAIILAGGQGTRLRPISCDIPKPMVSLMDKPIMEHLVHLLCKNGIGDICATLQYMPHIITNYFEDGRRFGVNITYSVETEPLGTAGAVKNCSDFIGDDDFLVISGDGACDFDLSGCIDFHRQKGADVTVVLYRHKHPLEYGLVMTDRSGRIERFIEKPSWGQVFTDTINTGIYIISPRVLEDIPPNTAYDFARNLFPKLLSEGRALFGVAADGYWCDIGDCGAYLRCAMDALSGKLSLIQDAPRLGSGIWSAVGLPKDAKIIPPCYIGERAVIGEGARVGPGAVIGAGSFIGAHARAEHCVIDGAHIGERTSVCGAVVCKGAAIKSGTSLGEGSVVGAGTVVGENSHIFENVSVWPNKVLPAGAKVARNLVTGNIKNSYIFEETGVIRGEANIDITPESCIALGGAANVAGRVGIGCGDGEAAKVMSEAIACGVRASGGDVLLHDAQFDAAAAYCAGIYDMPVSIYVSQKGGSISLRFFGRHGLPIVRELERKIEGAFARGEFNRACSDEVGHARQIKGAPECYAVSAAKSACFPDKPKAVLKIAAPVKNSANDALRSVLTLGGCVVCEERSGLPVFSTDPQGFRLQAFDERGVKIDNEKIQVLLALIEFETGKGRIAVPYNAPGVIDLLAGAYNSEVYRIGRDGDEAVRLYEEQSFMRDGIFAAARICARLARSGESLADLVSRLPKFSVSYKEIDISGDRGMVMRALAESCSGTALELYEGIRAHTQKGWVHISPLLSRSALRITGEGATMESAEELCALFERRAKKIEQPGK